MISRAAQMKKKKEEKGEKKKKKKKKRKKKRLKLFSLPFPFLPFFFERKEREGKGREKSFNL